MKRLLTSLLLSTALLLGQMTFAIPSVFAETIAPIVIAGSAAPATGLYLQTSLEPWSNMNSETVTLSVLKKDGDNTTVQNVSSWSITAPQNPTATQVTLTKVNDTSANLLVKQALPTLTITAVTESESVTGTIAVSRRMPSNPEIWGDFQDTYTYTGAAQNATGYSNLVSSVSYFKPQGSNPAVETPFKDVGTYNVFFALKRTDQFVAHPKKAGPDATITPFALTKEKLVRSKESSDFSFPIGAPSSKTETQSISFSGLDSKATARFSATLTYQFPSTKTPGTHKDGTVTVTDIQVKNDSVSNYTIPSSLTVNDISYTIEAAVPKSLTVTKQPDGLAYRTGQTLNLSGMEVTLTYSDGSTEAVSFANFASKQLSTTPANGVALKDSDNGKPITVTLNGSGLQTSTLPLTVKKSGLDMTVTATPAEITGGGDVTVKVKLTKDSQSTAPFPAASEILLSNDMGYPVKTALNGSNGEYTAVYTLPNLQGTGTFTATFKGNESYGSISQSGKVVTKPLVKNDLTMTVTAAPAEITGGGDVTVTVKLAKVGSQSTIPFPAASEIQLTNDKNYPVKTALSGFNGVYTAVYTVPNEQGTGTFTATFKGNESYSSISQSGKVTATFLVKNSSDMNNYLKNQVASAGDYKKPGISNEAKASIEADARLAQASIAKLSDADKSQLSGDSLKKLDDLLKEITQVEPTIKVTSYYGKNSTAKMPDSGVSIIGAVAAVPNVQSGNTVTLGVKQNKANLDSRELLKVDLTLNVAGKARSSTVPLQVPVTVTLPLPSEFTPRSNMFLRHFKSSGGYEDLSPTINGSRGKYTMTFTTNGFSSFALLWKTNTSNNTGGGSFFETYTITAKSGTGGSISPSGNVKVDVGDSKTFTVKANSGYRVSKVLVDGEKKVTLKNGKYTFEDVTEPYSIEVVFEKIPQAVTSRPTASSKPSTSSKPTSQVTPKPQQPSTSSRYTPPASSAPSDIKIPEPSKPEISSAESLDESSESDEESSSMESGGTVSDGSSSGGNSGDTSSDSTSSGEMSDADLTVAVVIIIVVVALSLTAVFFGIYLYRKRNSDNDD